MSRTDLALERGADESLPMELRHSFQKGIAAQEIDAVVRCANSCKHGLKRLGSAIRIGRARNLLSGSYANNNYFAWFDCLRLRSQAQGNGFVRARLLRRGSRQRRDLVFAE